MTREPWEGYGTTLVSGVIPNVGEESAVEKIGGKQ
jgi:hypothetical protein